MSGCMINEIEAYVLGELGGARAAEVRAHADACRSCAAELRAVRAERALFAARAEHEQATLAPPSFPLVLRRSRGASPSSWSRRAGAVGVCLAAAAALALFFTAGGGDDPEAGHIPQRFDPPSEVMPPEFSCYEGEPISAEENAYVLDRAIVRLEDQYGACLVATPTEEPYHGGLSCREPSHSAGEY